MNLMVEYDGKRYEVKEHGTAASSYDAAREFREFIDRATSISLPLANGEVLILGKEAIQRAVFLVVP